MSDPLKFRKRKGTTDLGKLYEANFPASVILKLLQNKEIKDFRISANDDQFGDFDDFVLEVDYTNKPTEKFAVQMKHKENSILTIENLKETNKQFGVLNYAQNCDQLRADYKLILFTNAKFKTSGTSKTIDNVLVDVGQNESVQVIITQCVPSLMINTSEERKSYKFQLAPGNSEEIKQKYNNFFERFFLYTNQSNAHELEKQISQSLGMLTSKNSVSTEFLKFISDWSIKDGIKNKLTKDIIIKVLTLRIVEGLIHPHTFCEVNKKKKIIQKAISQFNITAFNNKSLNQVVKIWGDAKSLLRDYDVKEINEILRKFQISTRYITEIDDLTDEESTKLLWVMDKCPLILKDGPAAYEAATLCGEKSKFIFIADNLDYEKLQELKVFKTLTDLKRSESTYDGMGKEFTFTLFGEETGFEKLIKEDDAFEDLITTDEIAKIADNINLTKLEDEELCFPYVERRLCKNIIDFKYLKKLDKNTTVLLSNIKDVKKIRNVLQKFEFVFIMDELHKDTDNMNSKIKLSSDTFSEKYNVNRIEEGVNYGIENFGDKSLQNDTDTTKDEKMGHDDSLTKHRLFFNKTETSSQEFASLCNKNKKYQRFHHLRFHDGYFEWIESIGDVLDLRNFSIRSNNFIEEDKYAENIRPNVNIVIGDPGMGKSVFVKKLKNNLKSKYLPVMILPAYVPKLCQVIKHPKTLQKFFNFILETKFSNFGNFERQVLKLFMVKGKAVFLWDALDELEEENRKFVEELIKTLSENSVPQIVTSRGFLRKHLENKFNVFSQKLQPFDDKEQTVYIRERLQDVCDNEKLETITGSIKENIAQTSYNDILGIPLQIYMLTELFRQDLPKYKKLLCDFFVVSDLYCYFIEEKFNVYLEMKKKFPPNYKENSFIEDSLSRQKQNYQHVALKSIFGAAFSTESSEKSDLFLKRIKEKGDEFGLITAVDINLNSEFLHNSYAEYFAASYLAENCRSIPNPDLIFDKKHSNVKYFFDLLLAKNSPVHIAVLCKNLKYVQNCNTEELKSKDLQGRTALHLAASWGERYPLLETSVINNDFIFWPTFLIKDNINYKTKEENKKYYQIMEVLLEHCDLNKVDDLFNLTPTMYAEKCECLFAAAIIGKKIESKSYLGTKNDTFIYSLLYYAIKYKFTDIVNLFDNLKFITTKNGNSFLHMAAAYNQYDYLKELLKYEIYRRNINHRNSVGKTALMIAAENGYTKAVKFLKKKNAIVDAADKYGFTPLMAAAQNGHIDTVKYLIQQNANVNAVANDGNTPLHLASSNGHLNTVKYLTQQNANVNAATNKEHTSPYLGVFKEHHNTVKYSKQQNAKVDVALKESFTPLMRAAMNGHLNTVKYLVREQNANVNAVSIGGVTSLCLAASNGHLKTVKYLKEHNATVDVADKDGFTPLMRAAMNGHLDTVKYLVEQNANVNAGMDEGLTPFHLAAFMGHLEIVKYLRKHNTTVDVADKNGFTPLMRAAMNGHLDTVKYLVEQNAKVNAAANDGQTPLCLAALNDYLEIVKYLKEQNAKVDVVNKNGVTPLWIATANGNLDMVEYLIQQNANVNASIDGGKTPFHLAALMGHLEIVEYLKQHNAKVDAVEEDGFTPLMMAALEGHLNTVKYLIKQNANVNAAGKNGVTPLHSAAVNGHLSTVRYLIEQNANVNAARKDGITPLHSAAANGHLSTVKYFI